MYRIRFRNHFRAVPFLLFAGLFFFVVALFEGLNPLAIKILGGAFLFLFVPCLFLHIEYLAANAGLDFEINETGIRITKAGRIIRDVDIQEIKGISIYRSPLLYSGLPTEHYFYARVTTLDNGPDVIVTSLIANKNFDVLAPLWKVKTEKKGTLFPSIRFPLVIPGANFKYDR